MEPITFKLTRKFDARATYDCEVHVLSDGCFRPVLSTSYCAGPLLLLITGGDCVPFPADGETVFDLHDSPVDGERPIRLYIRKWTNAFYAEHATGGRVRRHAMFQSHGQDVAFGELLRQHGVTREQLAGGLYLVARTRGQSLAAEGSASRHEGATAETIGSRDHEGGTCPVCGGTETGGGFVETGGGTASQRMGCTDCGASWVEMYGLTGRREVENGAGVRAAQDWSGLPRGVARYYTDDGVRAHQWKDRKLLVALAEALTPMVRGRFSADRALCMDAACSLIMDYDVRSSLSGLGGCTSVDSWRHEVPGSPVEAALKGLFLEFVDGGHVPGEFRLAAFDAVCEVQVCHVVHV